MDINIYYRYAPVANPLGHVLPVSVSPLLSFRSITEVILKLINKIMDHKRKAMFDFGLCHFFRSGVMPLFALTESGGIHVRGHILHECVALSFNIYLHYHYTFCKYKEKKTSTI